MKGKPVRVEITYRTCGLIVWGEWYDDNAALYISSAHLEDDEGDFWPIIEGTEVGEELTKACEDILRVEAQARDAELKATGGMGEGYADQA